MLIHILGALLYAHMGCASAHAETSQPESYDAAFFAPFSPQNALDMIQRLPGFTYDAGDESVRGFAEAGGNVLVDGARPVVKSGGLDAALVAIPARQVVRIDIVRKGATGAETSGQNIVANIVLAREAPGVTASATATGVDGSLFGDAALNLTRTLGRFHLTSTTRFDSSGQRSYGFRDQATPAGLRLQHDALRYDTDYPEWTQRLSLDGALGGGRTSVNAMLARARLVETFAFENSGQADRFPDRKERWRGELSADWTRALPRDYDFKLLALTNFTDIDGVSLSQTGGTLATLRTTDRLAYPSHAREAIARATLAKGGDGAWRPEGGVELSWNTLDSRSAMTHFDPDGSPRESSPTHDHVSEARAEAFGALNWLPSPRWALDVGAALETSRIEAGGDSHNRNRFTFLKPHLSVTYTPDASTDISVSLRCAVGQLSFSDFAASANLVQGLSASGNPDLGPDEKISAEFDYTRRFGARGGFSLSAVHDWRRNVLEPDVLPSGAFVVANVRSARAWSLMANLDLPLDGFMPGGLLRLHYMRQDSRVTDPVTGAVRRLNATQPVNASASFRQDLRIARLSWGVDYARGWRGFSWYADEARLDRHAPELGLFMETGRFLNAKLRVEVQGLTGRRDDFHRQLYAPNRAGLPARNELWEIDTPTALSVSLTRNF